MDTHSEISDELELIAAVLRGYPQSLAQSDALRSVHRISELLTCHHGFTFFGEHQKSRRCIDCNVLESPQPVGTIYCTGCETYVAEPCNSTNCPIPD